MTTTFIKLYTGELSSLINCAIDDLEQLAGREGIYFKPELLAVVDVDAMIELFIDHHLLGEDIVSERFVLRVFAEHGFIGDYGLNLLNDLRHRFTGTLSPYKPFFEKLFIERTIYSANFVKIELTDVRKAPKMTMPACPDMITVAKTQLVQSMENGDYVPEKIRCIFGLP